MQGATGSISQCLNSSMTDHFRQRVLAWELPSKQTPQSSPMGPSHTLQCCGLSIPFLPGFFYSCGMRTPHRQTAVEQSWLNSKEKHHYLELRSSQPSKGDCSSLITYCILFCFEISLKENSRCHLQGPWTCTPKWCQAPGTPAPLQIQARTQKPGETLRPMIRTERLQSTGDSPSRR